MRRPGFINISTYTFDGRVIDLGRRVRQYRKLWDNMTQSELAKKVGCASSYISAIELNRITPSDEMVGKIAKAFGVSINDLLGI